jgi:hypothetical protein
MRQMKPLTSNTAKASSTTRDTRLSKIPAKQPSRSIYWTERTTPYIAVASPRLRDKSFACAGESLLRTRRGSCMLPAAYTASGTLGDTLPARLASCQPSTQFSLAMSGRQSEAQQFRPSSRTQLGHGAHDISIR